MISLGEKALRAKFWWKFAPMWAKNAAKIWRNFSPIFVLQFPGKVGARHFTKIPRQISRAKKQNSFTATLFSLSLSLVWLGALMGTDSEKNSVLRAFSQGYFSQWWMHRCSSSGDRSRLFGWVCSFWRSSGSSLTHGPVHFLIVDSAILISVNHDRMAIDHVLALGNRMPSHLGK